MQWLLPLHSPNENELTSDFTRIDNQERLDEWQHVALVLDRLFFLGFIIAMPCTALLFVRAHLSGGNNILFNLTNTKDQFADAKCNEKYQPILT